ncbi:MAG: tRNA (adenosine(37)-N6)-threonylcarbamoyltransferase complex dimerization subunit type 1 TsaB [Actinobacteria bacterium]|nr:tRNA (adenosine(37)-N6)-threonylcarbamoyltransferase complex dimerization subunit type 1 TsaB [Actinomycetota bacterium]
MKTILAVDSTTEILKISVSDNDKILSEQKDNKNRKHVVNIINNIDTVFKNAGKSIKDVDLFAINLGPGDFTGGRIGISVVKIFSMLSGKPVYGFNSLDVFSTGCFLKNIKSIAKKKIGYDKVYIIPLMDVRNNEIYFSIYEVKNKKGYNDLIFNLDFEDQKYYLYKKTGNFLLNSDDFNKKFPQVIEQLDYKLKSQIFLTANAIRSYKSLLTELKDNILAEHGLIRIEIDEKNIYPDSRYLNYLSNYSFDNNLKPVPVTPVYVRDFITLGKK